MLKPWAKNSASPARRFGAMSLAYRCRWTVSGTTTITRSAQALPSAGGTRAARCLGGVAGPSGRPAAALTAGIGQRQRVRVALGAVTEHGDLAGLDEAEVGLVVVEHGGHLDYLHCRWTAAAAGRVGSGLGGHRGRRRQLHDLEHVDELVELPGQLLERLVAGVDHDGHAAE